MSGRPKTPLVLSATEREQLIALTKRRKTAQALALRARIVLACAEGLENKVVAARQRVTQQTVSKWRGRFVQLRLDGLLDAPRPGAPGRRGTPGQGLTGPRSRAGLPWRASAMRRRCSPIAGPRAGPLPAWREPLYRSLRALLNAQAAIAC